MNDTHDTRTCEGCNYLMSPGEVAMAINMPLSTTRKWCARGYPIYPKAAKLPNGRVMVHCADLRTWLRGQVR